MVITPFDLLYLFLSGIIAFKSMRGGWELVQGLVQLWPLLYLKCPRLPLADVCPWSNVGVHFKPQCEPPHVGGRQKHSRPFHKPKSRESKHYLTYKQLNIKRVYHPHELRLQELGLAREILTSPVEQEPSITPTPDDNPEACSDPVDSLLQKYDPITWYRACLLNDAEFITSRQGNRHTRALHAAAKLVRDLELSHPVPDMLPNLPRKVVYLSEGEKGSELDVPIVIDSGASFSLTPFKSDFIGSLDESEVSSMNGIADKVKIEGVGMVEWHVRDVFGQARPIRTMAYYVPQANIRLFSPQTYFQENQAGRLVIDHLCTSLVLADDSALVFPFQKCNNLPWMFLTEPEDPGISRSLMGALDTEKPVLDVLNVMDHHNTNLKANQKELLLWHCCLAHAGFDWIKSLMAKPKNEIGEKASPPVIGTKEHGTSNCVAPVCPGCQLAKQHRRSPGSVTHAHKPNQEMAIKKEDLKPGDCISMDQFISAVPGRLPHTFGKESSKDRYSGGTIMVDHASGYIHCECQVSLRTGSTIQTKNTFQKFAAAVGVILKHFRADNAPFGSKEFLEDLELNGQDIDFSGVGAHHQNGVAERALQTVTK